MQFIIHKAIFGSPQHYLWDANSRKGNFVQDIPASAWVIGDSTALKSVDLLALVEHKEFSAKHEVQARIFERLGVYDNIPWHKVMPKNQFKSYIKSVLDGAQLIVKDSNRIYYEKIFISSRGFLDRLGGIKIDKQKLQGYLETESNPSLRSALMTCRPVENGFSREIRYDLTSSKTGRLTVTDGPRVLTLKKNYRDIFTSEWEGGSLVAIDYKSLEARIALAIGGQDAIPLDPYLQIAKHSSVDRKTAKIATLSIMFGSGTKRIQEATQLTQIEATMLVAYIKDAIGYTRIVEQLKKELADTGFITNYYGRKLDPGTTAEHILYNNYIQSTGVDVALLGFSQMEAAVQDNEFVKPKFIVHDCLYIDIHPEYNSIIKELQSAGLSIPSFTTPFYSSDQ